MRIGCEITAPAGVLRTPAALCARSAYTPAAFSRAADKIATVADRAYKISREIFCEILFFGINVLLRQVRTDIPAAGGGSDRSVISVSRRAFSALQWITYTRYSGSCSLPCVQATVYRASPYVTTYLYFTVHLFIIIANYQLKLIINL